jgi:hypothetical protein
VPVRVFHALNGYRHLNDLWRALRLTLRPRLGFPFMCLFGKETVSETSWYALDGEERSLLTPTHEVPIDRQPAGSLAWTKTFAS